MREGWRRGRAQCAGQPPLLKKDETVQRCSGAAVQRCTCARGGSVQQGAQGGSGADRTVHQYNWGGKGIHPEAEGKRVRGKKKKKKNTAEGVAASGAPPCGPEKSERKRGGVWSEAFACGCAFPPFVKQLAWDLWSPALSHALTATRSGGSAPTAKVRAVARIAARRGW